MVRFSIWLTAITTILKLSRAYDGFELHKRGLYFETCQGKTCDSGRVCIQQQASAICAVKDGLPCTSNDFCVDGYYCPRSKVCGGGPDGIAEGSPCPDGIGCKPGLYCDPTQHKCLRIGGGSYCTGDFECKCSAPRGCYCDNGECFPNP